MAYSSANSMMKQAHIPLSRFVFGLKLLKKRQPNDQMNATVDFDSKNQPPILFFSGISSQVVINCKATLVVIIVDSPRKLMAAIF